MNEKKVPKVRFQGFSGEWKKQSLESLAIFSKGKGFSKSDLVSEGFPIILYGRLYTKYESIISEVDTFIADNSNAIISKGTEVIVPASGETAEDISRASVVEKKGVAIGGDLNIIYPNEDIIPVFLAMCVSNGMQQREMMKRAQGKSVVHLHNSDLSEIELIYPSKLEQTQIGEFFKNLDSLIAQNQKKYDKLVNMKKACLDKMFPKDGADTPEVRFKGFDGKWKGCNLKEASQTLEYGLNAAATKFDGKNKYIRITDIDDELRNFSENDLSSPCINLTNADNYKLQNGDILFARTGASVGKSYKYQKTDGLVYYAGFLIRARIKPEYNTTFIFQNTLTKKYEKYILVTSQRSGQPGVNAQEYGEFNFFAPSYVEQTKIGTFFQNLDTLITLQKTKLEKLKNIKKACLDKMFI